MATLVSQKAYNQDAATGDWNTESATPALNDLVWIGMNNSIGTDAALTGGGMTWEIVGAVIATASSFGALFRATAGTPSAGVLNFTTSDTGRDPTYQWIRPGAGTAYNAYASDSDSGVSLTLDLSGLTGTVAELIAFGHQAADDATIATDTGWTKISDVQTDDVTAGAECSGVQYRTTDDSEWIFDPSGTGGMSVIVVEMVAAAGGDGTDISGEASFSASTLVDGFLVYVSKLSTLEWGVTLEGTITSLEAVAEAASTLVRTGASYVKIGASYVISSIKTIVRGYDD